MVWSFTLAELLVGLAPSVEYVPSRVRSSELSTSLTVVVYVPLGLESYSAMFLHFCVQLSVNWFLVECFNVSTVISVIVVCFGVSGQRQCAERKDKR